MKTISLKNQKYNGANGRPSLCDLEVPANWNKKLIIFLHGYMGYKDWGCWNLVQKFFVEQGFAFLKYNVSHNGGTITNPIDFDDLDAFAKNTYTNEIRDFESIMDEVEKIFDDEMPEVCLIGHSRGGGIALLQSRNKLVDKICSWAGISSIERRFPSGNELESWKSEKVRYTTNGRTKQQMPHSYEQYEDFIQHKDRLNIEKYCKESSLPTCIIHGEEDTSVSIDEGKQLANWLNTPLVTIPDTAHTFDSAQPWDKDHLPEALLEVCRITLQFFNQPSNRKNREKLSIMSDLVKLAKSDNEIRDKEFEFLCSIAVQLGVTKDEFKLLFEKYIEFNPPKLEVDRIVQFQRLILLMNVDQDIDAKEMDYIRSIGIRMGLHPGATDEVLKIMHNYEGKVVPPEKLIAIFKTFHN